MKTAKPGMHVPPWHAPGTTSKHISRPPNASYATKCAQPNKPVSTATLHSIQRNMQLNHQQNIKKPSSTWHPPLLLIANSSPNLPLLLPLSTNTSVNSTQPQIPTTSTPCPNRPLIHDHINRPILIHHFPHQSTTTTHRAEKRRCISLQQSSATTPIPSRQWKLLLDALLSRWKQTYQ